jgi:hypothetical protein
LTPAVAAMTMGRRTMSDRFSPGVRAAQGFRRIGFACALAVVALAVAPAAGAASHAADGIVPAWAMADGRLPLSGATVDVVTTGGGGRSEQSIGSMKRTYATGTFLFHATRPLHSFTVTVTGGRLDGKPFDGTMRAVVRAYRPLTVVHVNPVTTLVASYLDLHPGISLPDATRAVKRFLGLPKWSTVGRDVRRSRALFDGSKFLAQADEAGGFDALIQRLSRQVDDPGTSHAFRAGRRTATAAVSTVDGVGVLTSLASSLGAGAASYVGGAAAGWLLAQFGLGDGLGPDLAQIQQQLQQIADDLTTIKSQLNQVAAAVVQGTYSQLAADAAPILGEIDYAEGQLSLLANLPPGAHPADFSGGCADPPSDDERAIVTCNLIQYIRTNLVGQDAVLNKVLVQPAPGADSILVAASKAVRAATTTFFDPDTSAEVESVQSYYSAYEADLLDLLVEYDHTLGSAGADEAQLQVQQMAAAGTGYAAQQQAVMKPPVLPNEVIDLRSGLVWQQQALGIGPAYAYDAPSCNGDAGIPSPWSLPASGQLDALFSGWSGSPEAWLEANAGMGFATAAATLAGSYGGDGCAVWSTDFDPGDGSFVAVGVCATNGGQHFEEGDAVGTALGLVFRPLTSGESYWYSP